MNRILVLLTFMMGTWCFVFAQDETPLDDSFIFVDENGNEIVDGSIITIYGLNNSGEMSIPLKVKNVSGKKVAVSMYETIDEKPNGDWTTCAFGSCMALGQSGYSAKNIVDANYNVSIETAWIPKAGQYAIWQATLQIHIFNIVPKVQFGQTMETPGDNIIGYGPKITINFVYDENSVNNTSSYIVEEPLVITAKVSNYNRIYGDENPDFAITYTGFIDGDDESCFLVKPSASTPANIKSNVGTYPITIGGGVSAKYRFKYESGELKIEKAPLSAIINDSKKKYGEENPLFTIDYFGLKNNETEPEWISRPTFITDATQNSGIGQYELKASNGIPINYDLGDITSGYLTITPAPLTIRARNAARKYFEMNPTFNYTCSGFVNNEDEQVLSTPPTITTEATQASDVGIYPIVPYGASASNYIITYEQGKLTITKRKLTVTSNCTREYGEENPNFTFSCSGFVNGENESVLETLPTITTTATKTSNVGEYPITVSGGNAKNYTLVYELGTLTITKAPLSAKVDDATKVYGTKNPAFTIDYYGLKNEETVPAWLSSPTFQTNATQSSAVGTYEVKAVNGVPINYDLGSITPGTLNITPASLTIKANDAVRQYFSEEPDFSFTCNGLVNGDDESVLSPKPTLSTSATKTSNVGKYEIKVSGASSQNYSISFVNGTLTVTPRTLMASVGNYERLYNEDNPAFEVYYSGFVGNEDETVLFAKATASTTATKTSDVGTYPINVSGGDADNYVFTYTSGTLTINKAEQTIFWEQDFSNINVGDQVELKAEASSGLPIEYILNNNSLASTYIANGRVYLDCLEEGTLVVRALQEGNNNYYAAVRKSKTIVIGNPSGIETISTGTLDAPVYDLMGNRVKVLVKGRVYIQNGKKFVVK